MELDPQSKVPFAGRFVLKRELGHGGYGVVWAALDSQNGLPVALKFLPAELAGDATAVATLRREVKTAHGLDHPHIRQVRALHEPVEGVPFVEMELVEGVNLTQHLAAAPLGFLSWTEVAPLAAQLCDALSYAHAQGVVHCDVKPSNLLIAQGGMVKLGDFGCSSLLDATVTHTLQSGDGSAVGTLAFMSPQRVNGLTPHLSDDVYAVGATLYTLLAGKPPFYTGHVLHQILNRRAPTLHAHQRALGVVNPVPPAVACILHACLHKRIDHRPASMAVLADELAGQHQPPSTRRRVLCALTALGGLATLGGFARWQQTRSAEPKIETGFTSVFNGRDLAGWSGDPAVWNMRNGCVVGRLTGDRSTNPKDWRNEYLVLSGPPLGDFEFRTQVKLVVSDPDAGNLGVKYRIVAGRDPKAPGYQLDFEANWRRNGGLREFGGRDTLARPGQRTICPPQMLPNIPEVLGNTAVEPDFSSAYRAGEWNDLVIRAEGSRLIHELNGLRTAEVIDEAHVRRLIGSLALKVFLYFGPEVEAWFRHIRLRRLTAE